MKEGNTKVALILGGTGGIGSSIADAFESDGINVCRHGVSRGEYVADLSKDGEAKRLVESVVSEYGRIDILVNSISSPLKRESVEKKTWKDFEKHFNVQLKAVVETTRFIVPLMKEQNSGRIINILSTVVNSKTSAGLSDYTSLKYALWGLTKSFAKELGKYGITANAISPGFIRNSLNESAPTKLDEIIIHGTPLARLTTEEDIANTALFLASDKAGFITGQNIIVDGGSSA